MGLLLQPSIFSFFLFSYIIQRKHVCQTMVKLCQMSHYEKIIVISRVRDVLTSLAM